MATPSRKPFVTGSHAYGIPTRDSDIDLVVLVSKKDFERLYNAAESRDEGVDNENYLKAGGMSMRFGKLNLLAVVGEKMYDIWREGTTKLKKQAPVTRAFACEYFRRLRKKAGFRV